MTTKALTQPRCRIQENAHYKNMMEFGGNRFIMLQHDGWKCRVCEMTNEEHRRRFGRDLTVNHKDGRGRNAIIKNNDLNNLETLCLPCHGRTDVQRKLTPARVLEIRKNYAEMRNFQTVADLHGISRTQVQRIILGVHWAWLKSQEQGQPTEGGR